MAKFSYTASDIDGIVKQGTIGASDPADAASRLRGRGLFPSRIEPVAAAAVPRRRLRLDVELRLPAVLETVKPRHLMIFTRQLSTLVRAGLPLLRALKVLERQERNAALGKAVGAIASAIEGGGTFTDALERHPRIFSRLYVNMVRAGETGGVLDTVLDRLADYMEKTHKIRNKIRGAMTYPMVVMAVSAAIVFFLMTSIIPRFQAIFADLLEGRALPPLTRFVMGVSASVQHGGLPIIAGIVGLIVVSRLSRRFRGGRVFLDTLKLHLPFFGPLVRMGLLARFARMLGTLMDAGVPVLQALLIVKETLGNEPLADAVQAIHDSVKEGESMAAPIGASRLFPPMFGGMVEVGEETGALPAMLSKVADLYEDEVDNAVAALGSIIEPLLIVLLALVVGTIVVALFLPMVSILGHLK